MFHLPARFEKYFLCLLEQIWRLVTCFFYFPITPMTGFAYLINLYFLYNYSTRLETGLFQHKPADYLFMLLFCGVGLLIAGLLFTMYILMTSLIMSALYVWCQVNRDTVVQFWFGTQFKAMYLPWILLAFNFILRGSIMGDLAGILAGHLYFFAMIKYPQDFGGRTLFSTPQIFYRYLPNERGVSGFGNAPQARRNNDGRHAWGRGHTLG
jgi:derlin-1